MASNKPKEPKSVIKLEIKDADIFAILRTFKNMDKIASEDLRTVARELSEEIADAIKGAAANADALGGNPRQAIAIASTIKVNRDRVPSISIGGSRSVTSSGAKAGEILFGAEFGSRQYKQFPRRRPKDPGSKGNQGYFIFPTLKYMQPRIKDKWVAGVDRIRNEWKGRLNG
jgi:hypothetical protein